MEVLYRCFYVMLMLGNRRLLLNWTSTGHPLYPRLRFLFENVLATENLMDKSADPARLRLLFEDALADQAEVTSACGKKPRQAVFLVWKKFSTCRSFHYLRIAKVLIPIGVESAPVLLPRKPQPLCIQTKNINGLFYRVDRKACFPASILIGLNTTVITRPRQRWQRR